jgi:chitin synthase
LYVLVCAIFLVVLAFADPTVIQSTGVFDFIRKFLVSTNGVILIALAATFGVYTVASLLYLDPWHMLTSFPQYSLMVTSYINILNVYAFCNWHDVSWGTKGADKADALPSAQSTKKSDDEGVASVEILEYELPQTELDSKFEKVVKRALAPYKEPESKESLSMDDAYKSFRTNLIIVWIFS